MIVSSSNPLLKKKHATMEEFAEAYTHFIEVMIDMSNNHKCPKIQANYDDFGTETIRPLNSAIFYYFFSASSARRGLA